MAKAAPRATRSDRLLHVLQRTGMRRGLFGTSKGWTTIFVGALVLRRIRKAIGSEPEVVYRGELKAGEAFTISHLPQTYDGRRVRVRRRKITPVREG
jgi:hypothetical protein